VSDDAAPTRVRKLRIPLLAILAIAIASTAIWLARTPASQVGMPALPSTGTGGAAIRSPAGPTVPSDATGVRISGIVVDGAGVPVTGAEVSAELERGAPDQALATAATDAGAPAPAVHVGAPTESDGRFVIGGLDPGRYRLRVTGTGLLAAEVRYIPVPSDEVRIVVARQVRVEGTVIDGTTPARGATVALRGEAIGGTIETRTDSAGKFAFAALPEGRYQVYAYQRAVAARTVRVNRLGAGPFAPIELRFEAAAIVVGKVIDRESSGGIVAAVELRPIGDDQAPRYARTGDDGVFRIEGVPHGEWIADAFAPGYTSPGGVALEAGRGIPELALVRGGVIEGRILDADHNPLAGATVRALGTSASAPEYSAAVDQDRLRRFSGRLSAPFQIAPKFTADPGFIPRGELGVTTGPIPPIPPPGAQLATRQAAIDPAAFIAEPEPLPQDARHAAIWSTGSDGRFRIAGLPKGKVVVLATAPNLAEGRSRTIAIDVGRTVDGVDIVLTAGTRLAGKVTDQHGTPVVGAEVTATPSIGAPLSAFTDAGGEYTLGPVAGTVELAATAYGHGDVRRTLELEPVRGTTPATRREDLTLVVADAILAGTIDDAAGATVAGATVEMLAGPHAGRRAVSGADGTFTIDLLPAGTHRVRVTHPDYPPVELEADASTGGRTRARLRIPLGGAVAGVLLEAATGTPIAGMLIVADGPGAATADATTDNTGQFTLGPLAPGRWKIVIKQPGYLPLTHALDVSAARAPGATSVRDVRLELQRGALVGGTVRDARGQRAAGATIRIQRSDDTGPVVEGTTDSQGEFRIHDCPTGEITVTATKGDAAGSTRTTIRAGDEVLSLAIDLR
jgi:hypothetical protein